jgi:hypothetical protein
MTDAGCLDSPEPEPIAERDVLTMLAMLEYLAAEVGKIDAMSAHCLMLARKALLDAVGDSLVNAH